MRGGWGALRRYARRTPGEQARCLAWFTLGIREYEAGDHATAAPDLERAAEPGCPLSDYAEFYEALADHELDRDQDAIATLTGFAGRHPASVLRLRAKGVLAEWLIKSGQPQKALEVLSAEPTARTTPSFLLLTAQADEALQNDLAAVKTYQRIYVDYPNIPEALDAQRALDQLRRRMGSRYPELTRPAETERARQLFRHGFYEQALGAFNSLLASSPDDPYRANWIIGRAECLLALRRYKAALRSLDQEETNPELDAERLALQVRSAELIGDQAALLRSLDALCHKYPQSGYYGDALAYAAGYFARQGLWQAAGRYYAPLASGFADNHYAPEAAWRVAWYEILEGDGDAAQGALVSFLKRYPKSSFVPPALYWLATLEEEKGDSSPAGEIFRMLAERYASTYYGLKARLKLPATSKSRARVVREQPRSDVALISLGIELPARRDPPLSPCRASQPDELLWPFRTLTALDLDDLATHYLEDAIALHPEDARLPLAMARNHASQREASAALFSAKRAVPDYELYPFNALPEEIWKLLYPPTYWRLARRYAHAAGIDPYLVMGVIRQESAFNPHALSSARARGLMQMEPRTATERVRSRARRRRITRYLYSPAYNVRAGCLYLRSLLREFNGNLPQALAAYNAGDVRTRLWVANSHVSDPDRFLETIPFTDTRAYVEMVLRDQMIYRAVLTGRARFARCTADHALE